MTISIEEGRNKKKYIFKNIPENPDKTTTLYRIFLTNQKVYSIGGIRDTWEHPVTKELLHSFTMITTPANPLTWKIYNGGRNPHRMPLILSKEDERKWLNPDLSKENIQALSKYIAIKKWTLTLFSKDFGQRIILPEDRQGKLDF